MFEKLKTIAGVEKEGESKALKNSFYNKKTKSFVKFLRKSSNSPKMAFSVAEAMVTLLIVSIALAAAAPIISRNSNSNNGQYSELIRRIETLEAERVPSGSVMFFDPDVRNTCPDGWEAVPNKYSGRYFRVAGNYNICDRSGESANGSCAGAKTGYTAVEAARTLAAGTLQGDSLRRIAGTFPGVDPDVNMSSWNARLAGQSAHGEAHVNMLINWGITSGVFGYVLDTDVSPTGGGVVPAYLSTLAAQVKANPTWPSNNSLFIFNSVYNNAGKYLTYVDPGLLSLGLDRSGVAANWLVTKFDTQNVVPTDVETRPKTAVMLTCRKK